MTALLDARVLVIGASGVLGRELALECARRGGRIIGTTQSAAISDECDAEVQADITTSDGRSRILSAVSQLGGVDVVVIASGVVGFGSHDTVESGDIARLIEVDLIAPLQLLKELSPLISEGGNITALTGAVVDVSTLGMSTYSAAKSGLSAAIAIIRREMRARKITVLDARPPHTETGLATRAVFGNAPALKQGLAPSDVARRIVDAIENNESELAPAAFTV
jgi:cyclic-di-GMP-binding biofilm dispersal mediator protein